MSIDEREVLAGFDRHLDAVHAAFPVPPGRHWQAARRTVPGPWIAVATIAAIAIGIVALGRVPSEPGPLGSAQPGVAVSPSAPVSPSSTPAASFGDQSTAPIPTPTPSRPLDPAIAAVSRTHPGPAAQRAMDLCGVKGYGIGAVGGMGLIPDARRVPDYVPLTGREPELAVDKPAWVVAFRGWLTIVTRTRTPFMEFEDPVCVVIDDAPLMFVPGARRNGDVIATPPPSDHQPIFALPPLGP